LEHGEPIVKPDITGPGGVSIRLETTDFWPDREDICWYQFDDIVANIEEPMKVTNRHY